MSEIFLSWQVILTFLFHVFNEFWCIPFIKNCIVRFSWYRYSPYPLIILLFASILSVSESWFRSALWCFHNFNYEILYKLVYASMQSNFCFYHWKIEQAGRNWFVKQLDFYILIFICQIISKESCDSIWIIQCEGNRVFGPCIWYFGIWALSRVT